MIALARPDGEGDPQLLAYQSALRAGAARARGGVLPTVALLYELLHLPAPEPSPELDTLLRDAQDRTPPVLKAALAAQAFDRPITPAAPGDESLAAQLASLAVTLTLCVGGAITDAWLALPPPSKRRPVRPATDDAGRDPAGAQLGGTFAALAREARAAERALSTARELAARDELRVRDALGRAAYSALEVLALMRNDVVLTVTHAARTLAMTPPTAGAAVARLVELGIAREVTGKARSREFAYHGMVLAFEPEGARVTTGPPPE
jgi:hypothetical protein